MFTIRSAVRSHGRKLSAICILAGSLIFWSHAASTLALGGSINLLGPTSSGSPFTDVYAFNLASASRIKYMATYNDLRPDFPIGISSFVATLYSGLSGSVGAIISGTDGPKFHGLIPNSFELGSLMPGAYHLSISGVPSGSGFDTYSGSLFATAVVAPIPEPEIWAMMLVGLGLIGMRLRRKSHIDGARRFAYHPKSI